MSEINVWIQSFKGRKNLMLQWIDPDTGARKSQSAGTGDHEEAERQRIRLEHDLRNGRGQRGSRITWAQFREMFAEEYLPGLRPRSAEKYETVFDVFESEIGPTKLSMVNERLLSRFVQALRVRKRTTKKPKKADSKAVPRVLKVGLEPVTIRNYLVAMQTALKWGADQKLIPACPKFPKIKVAKKKPQPIPSESFERLLHAETDPLWRAYLCCGWWAGLRLSEAYSLRWKESAKYPWLDLERDRIVLPAEFAKSGEDQWVPVHHELRKMFESLPRTDSRVFPFKSHNTGKTLTRGGITGHIATLAKRAGVRLSMHRLRKGFGCRVASMLGKGNAPILHRMMRHKSMQITMDYYASVDDVLADSIADLK